MILRGMNGSSLLQAVQNGASKRSTYYSSTL